MFLSIHLLKPWVYFYLKEPQSKIYSIKSKHLNFLIKLLTYLAFPKFNGTAVMFFIYFQISFEFFETMICCHVIFFIAEEIIAAETASGIRFYSSDTEFIHSFPTILRSNHCQKIIPAGKFPTVLFSSCCKKLWSHLHT